MMQRKIIYMALMFSLMYACTTALEMTPLVDETLPAPAAGNITNEPAKEFTVTNPIQAVRSHETVSLKWNAINDAVPGLTKENAAIYSVSDRQFLLTQFVEIGDAELLFQDDFAAGQKKSYRLMKLPEGVEEPCPQTTTYCCFLPERNDDFAWENDKVANRMYGPALEYETITNGIDAFGKWVPYPIIEKLIRAYVQKDIPYHEFHGEGADFYKVGNTLGCGGMAPFIDEKVCLTPHNFKEWEILANGPIRSVFELTYQPWEAGPYTVSEKICISIDLGSNMTRLECHYTSEDAEILPLAGGIILRDTSEQTWTTDEAIAYWLPSDGHDYGMMGCGVVFGSDYETNVVREDSHLLLVVDQKIDTPVVYYAGSCWDKHEEFSSFKKWQQYLTDFKKRIDHPVVVKMKD